MAFDTVDGCLMVMCPCQIAVTERIIVNIRWASEKGSFFDLGLSEIGRSW